MILGNYNNSKQFQILDEGLVNATLAAVQDLGLVQSNFDGNVTEKPKIRLVFETDVFDTETNEPLIAIMTATNSMHEKSSLRKAVKSIQGKDSGDGKIDTELLIGAQVQLLIQHNESNGRTYANIASIIRRKDDGSVQVPEGWVPPKVKSYKAVDSDIAF